MANKEKQNWRLAKAINKQHTKVTFKCLNENEKAYIKAWLDWQRYDKELDNFYLRVKRLPNGIVDWESLSETEMQSYGAMYNSKKKAYSKMSKLETQINVDIAKSIFRQENTQSTSY